jgi:hypothetical protein
MNSIDFSIEFCRLCTDGHLQEAQQLANDYNNRTKLPDLSVVQQLYASEDNQALRNLFKVNDYFPDQVISPILFLDVCCNGHLEVAKWLKELVQDNDDNWDYNEAYCLACSNGHALLAIWLSNYANWENPIVFNNIRDASIVACSEGHLAVVKHMFNDGAPINLRNYFINVVVVSYLTACKHGRYDVVSWFNSLYPNHLLYTYDPNTRKLTYSVCGSTDHH